MFSEFLLLISFLLKMPQKENTLKLLNEVFVFDEVWQECVKAYTISLFLSDLVSGLPSQQTLDELRGISIVNFDEALFFDVIKSV